MKTRAKLEIDASSVDEAIEKTKQLKSLLQEVKKIIASLKA